LAAPACSTVDGESSRSVAHASTAATNAQAEQTGRVERFELAGSSVQIHNLAGSVEVFEGTGDRVVVEVIRGGANANQLEVALDAEGREPSLAIRYPSENLVYRSSSGGSFDVRVRPLDNGRFEAARWGMFGWSDGIRVRSSGRGIDAHADLRIAVPTGVRLQLNWGVGNVRADGLTGDLDVRSLAGDVAVREVAGALHIDTGSGDVRVAGAGGEVRIDTGSGDVELLGAAGPEVTLDTGSGDVRFEDLAAPSVRIDTGSGEVLGRNVDAGHLIVDTGSGEVDLAAVAVERLEVDTGSGGVRVELQSEPAEVVLDTGSGPVELVVPESINARLAADTGSGGIEADLDDFEVFERDRDRLVGQFGAGVGRISIDTGSGRIRVIRR
jgi:hypothetical protein